MPDPGEAARRQSIAMSIGYRWLFGAVPDDATIGVMPTRIHDIGASPRGVSGGILIETRDLLDELAAESGVTRSRMICQLLEARVGDLESIADSCLRLGRSIDGKIITVTGMVPRDLHRAVVSSAKAHSIPVARLVAKVIEDAVHLDF